MTLIDIPLPHFSEVVETQRLGSPEARKQSSATEAKRPQSHPPGVSMARYVGRNNFDSRWNWEQRTKKRRKRHAEFIKARREFIVSRAELMRHNATPAELAFGKLVEDGVDGVLFKFQNPKSRYILDFFSKSIRLCVEIDGGYHANRQQYDLTRDANLFLRGILTVRFTNEEVLNTPQIVLAKLREIIRTRRHAYV